MACSDLINLAGSAFIVTNASLISTRALNISDVDTTNDFPLCRVQGNVPYGLNNTITTELWLPESTSWNGRYMAVGNGGLAGVIDYSNMMTQINSGFAVAGGDSGHLLVNNGNGTTASGQAIPFLEDKEQTTAWIHNSIAALTPPTRDLATEYYGEAPSYSYYDGCSTGGAQGFSLAQYHPDLFDGIYAGSPGNWYSHLILSFLWNYVHSRNDSYLDQDTLNFITNSTIKQCDALDGVLDGLIEDPLKCQFKISSLACSSGQSPIAANNSVQCLTQSQILTYSAFRQGPIESDTNTSIYPGFDYGSESSWLYQETILAPDYSVPILQNLVYNNLSADPYTFDFSSSSVRLVNNTATPYLDAISPDLVAFKRRGGKMIITQGWADPYNAATWPMNHLASIDDFMSRYYPADGSASDFIGLFMVPGGGHCGGSAAYPDVPATYHVLDVLMPWVEGSNVTTGAEAAIPQEMESSDPTSGLNVTRKLCSWPKTATLKNGTGEGSIGVWTDYECI